ncbi:hypothetical protein [Streptomyces sp. NPDC086989]|uniref:hypothetical protein n=1 Tax=Streptomyces sp. NPDC086989 TaxID=3365764 RepID=UPI0038050AAC
MQSATEPTHEQAVRKAAIAAERREPANLFDALKADDRHARSPRVGWAAREVAALSLPATPDALLKTRGNLHRVNGAFGRRVPPGRFRGDAARRFPGR